MMKRHSLAAAVIAAGIPAMVVAMPVAADANSVSTPVTVEITGGSLSISAPATSVDLGSQAATVAGSTINGLLGTVQVLDARGAPAGSGWTATAISTALTPAAGPTIAAALIGYTVGTITQAGTATYAADNPPNLTGVSPVVTATGITGDNSATWDPTINVAVPGGTVPGQYSGSITHSVS
jgi:hypothetical protein